jgi:hypothetical protein
MPQIPGLKQRFFFFAKMRIHIHTKLTMLNLKCHGNICEVTKNKLSILAAQHSLVDDGSHNVSRWMTWLPISLKNAAKCDKWYQLQNLSITESLNANGTRKKLHWGQLRVCHSQCRTKTKNTSRFCAWQACGRTSVLSSPAGAVALFVLATRGRDNEQSLNIPIFLSCSSSSSGRSEKRRVGLFNGSNTNHEK